MITIFQHGEHEPAGTIEDCLITHHQPYEILRLFEDDTLPRDPPHQLIILGGQMSVNDEHEYPFLKPEKELVRETIIQGKTVLGICLGAQMIASAFGERVYPSNAELGWRDIIDVIPSPLAWHSAVSPVFHWHHETFNLPKGATLVAYGERVKNQAFLFGHAVGVQFHPEVTMPIISYWAKDLNASEHSQVLQESEKYLGQNRQRCERILDAFLHHWGI
ncbi:MAG: type 1 glutamine amidotransferase [Methanoregula sp.]|jgi:GMP synthase-like glutamine amidotransferase